MSELSIFIIRMLIAVVITFIGSLAWRYYKKAKKQTASNSAEEDIAVLSGYKKKSKLFFILFIVLFLGNILFFRFFNGFDSYYYDLHNNKYESFYDVVYYSADGTEYKKVENSYYFFEIDDPTVKLDGCYIDEEGYFVIKDKTQIKYDDSLPIEEPYCFYDSEGNLYASAETTYWDKNGNLVTYL